MLPCKRQRNVSKDSAETGKSRKQLDQHAAAGKASGDRTGAQSGGGAPKPQIVVLVDKSVRANDARRKVAQACAKARGNFTVLEARSPDQCPHPGTVVTHLVLGSSLLTAAATAADSDPKAAAAAARATRERLAPYLARWPGVLLLGEAWLTQLTSRRDLPATAGFELSLDPDRSRAGAAAAEGAAGGGGGGAEAGPRGGAARGRGSGAAALPAVAPRALPPEGKYEQWLGRWSREFDDLDEVAIMLQATFNDQRCARIGNSAIVAGLRELKQYEVAVREQGDVAGTRALAYARAAASVQACAFHISGSMPESLLVRHLPFVNLSCARTILQLAQSADQHAAAEGGGGGAEGAAAVAGGGSGSGGAMSTEAFGSLGSLGGSEGGSGAVACERLELFRRDLPVRDGGGALRPGSAGAASRRRLCKLPYVGPSTAKLWYDKGCRTLDDALAAVRSGRLRPPSRDVAWALEQHEALTADVTPEEVAEMVAATTAALAAATPLAASGWLVQLVGGGRRGLASHDVDIMVSHPEVADHDDMGQHFKAAVRWLMEAGQLMPEEGNCTRVHRCTYAEAHVRRTISSLGEAAQEDGEGRNPGAKARGVSDGLHYTFGVFRTSSGRLKRLDLLFCAWTWLPHAVLGWTGSTQFLRFLHQAAAARGFRRTNHALYRLDTRQPMSGIRNEAGIFEALGLPYREPQDRQC